MNDYAAKSAMLPRGLRQLRFDCGGRIRSVLEEVGQMPYLLY